MVGHPNTAGRLLLAFVARDLSPGCATVRGSEISTRVLKGPVLVVSNHVTYLDIAWILPALPERLRNRLATAMGGERLARMRRPPKSMNVFGRLLERLDYFLALALFNVFPLPQKSGFLKSFSFVGNLA